jgi:hypothetical protein
MPSGQTIKDRKSSLTNAFVNSILPRPVKPTFEEVEEALAILGMDFTTVVCAYCGNAKTEWDHLRPIVVNQRPTGYTSEIANLVPACNKCNQGKGNWQWKKWMLNPKADSSPSKRGIKDLADRIRRLEAYERWRTPVKIEFDKIIDPNVWANYWGLWEEINADLSKCSEVAETLRATVIGSLSSK